MKKTRILSLILAVFMVLSFMASCTKNEVSESGTAKIVIETKNEGENKYVVYEVDLSLLESREEGALSLLEYISSQEGSTLYYSATWGGGYGAYINSISPLTPDTLSGEYIGVYTSEECDFAVPTADFPTVQSTSYEGQTLKFSGVGVSSMHVKDGSVILFRLEKY